jgi:hypothetical protein
MVFWIYGAKNILTNSDIRGGRIAAARGSETLDGG